MEVSRSIAECIVDVTTRVRPSPPNPQELHGGQPQHCRVHDGRDLGSRPTTAPARVSIQKRRSGVQPQGASLWDVSDACCAAAADLHGGGGWNGGAGLASVESATALGNAVGQRTLPPGCVCWAAGIAELLRTGIGWRHGALLHAARSWMCQLHAGKGRARPAPQLGRSRASMHACCAQADREEGGQ